MRERVELTETYRIDADLKATVAGAPRFPP
jgi:hypothetical protein